MNARGRRQEWQKQKEMGWNRRVGRVRGIGSDFTPREKPIARKHFDHKPYGGLTEREGGSDATT